MKNTARLMRILGSATLIVGFSAPGWAVQHHHGHHLHHHGRLPAYDTTTESTLEGTVDELVRMDRPGCASCVGGTHVFLSGHDVEIHLGPSSFLESKGCRIKEGDELRSRDPSFLSTALPCCWLESSTAAARRSSFVMKAVDRSGAADADSIDIDALLLSL